MFLVCHVTLVGFHAVNASIHQCLIVRKKQYKIICKIILSLNPNHTTANLCAKINYVAKLKINVKSSNFFRTSRASPREDINVLSEAKKRRKKTF